MNEGITPDQLKAMFHHKTGKSLPLVFYDDIISESKNADDLFNGVPYMVVYYPQFQRDNLNVGHYVALCLNKAKDKPQISYYDPLAYGIDQYKQFSPQRKELYDEEFNSLVWWLLQYRKEGVLIEDNHHQHQSRKPDVATCGRHAIIRCIYHMLDNNNYNTFMRKAFGHGLLDEPVYNKTSKW